MVDPQRVTGAAQAPAHMMVPTALYRLYDDGGQLLYVGITRNPKARFSQHRRDKAWWDEVARKNIIWHRTWMDADAAERKAIPAERPRYNIAGTQNPDAAPRVARLKPVKTRQAMRPATRKRLRRAARIFLESRAELRAAIINAGLNGWTNLEIAQEIDFAYSPDHIGRLIRKEVGPRKPGRRPRKNPAGCTPGAVTELGNPQGATSTGG